jgi:hypothetical protein
MQYRPTAAELLADIAELLEREVLDAVPPTIQHKVRVAANVARILQQEVTLAPGNAARERSVELHLLNLPPDDPTPLPELRARLAAALREGELPGHSDEEVWEALVAITRDDLAISKPGHDSWQGDG